jgi:dCTP deaminase
MVLQDAEIVRRLIAEDESKRIVITPLINPAKQIGPSSVDVSLGGNFKIPMTSHIGAIDPAESEVVQRYLRSIEVGLDEPFYLHPGEFVLDA